MRAILDKLYRWSGYLAAACIVFICLIVSTQVVLNLLTRLSGARINWFIPSYTDFAGYALAAASFLALAYTLTQGGHIRVTLVVGRMGRRWRKVAELFSLVLAALLSGAASWFMIRLIGESLQFGDLSTGMVAIPIWIVQLPVAAGLVILTIALVDLFWQSLRSPDPVLVDEGGE